MARDGLPGVLFVGYGNEMCGDDAAGPLAARKLAARGFDALAVHQLTPELAERIASARAVVFLDADAALAPGEVGVEPLPAASAADQPDQPLEHYSAPAGLLRLARVAYGAEPAAWLIRMGGESFDFGAALSPAGEDAIRRAVDAAEALSG